MKMTVDLPGFASWFINPKVNDIVAFRDKEGKVLVKRITGSHNNNYFVEGDNKRDSLDSKAFGSILKRSILGKVIYRF